MADGRKHDVTRRAFVRGSLAVAATLPLAGTAFGLVGCTTPPLPADLPDGLFALGVASGDPLPDGVVLWTRLAPAPLEGGGMPVVDVPVRWQVAEDEAFATIAREGTAVAKPAWGHSVHVDVYGLRPGAWYFYRFLVGEQVSPVARARTAPALGAAGDRLRFLVGTCQNWRDGYWPTWASAAGEDADLVLHLGDYIYESGVNGGDNVRAHNSAEVRTLVEYRNRYGLYKGDPALQAAHAACPWVVTWDDHEVENNYAGLLPEVPDEGPAFPARRAAAYQAWWEHMPVRMRPPTGPDLRIHRSVDWGRLARFHVLDTRQYRSDQPCGQADLGESCDARLDPTRTLLGAEQEAWLAGGLASDATWDVLANQVVMTSMPLAGTLYNLDQWDGYTGARARLLDRLAAPDVANPVVLTGDIHAAGVGDVVDLDTHGPGAPAVATELVAPSISSRFDPSLADAAEQLIGELPHVRWVDVRRRGYIRCDVTPGELVARYQMASSVLTPDAPVATTTSWRVTAGQVGAQPA